MRKDGVIFGLILLCYGVLVLYWYLSTNYMLPAIGVTILPNGVPSNVQSEYDNPGGAKEGGNSYEARIKMIAKCEKESSVIFELSKSTGYVGTDYFYDASGKKIYESSWSDAGILPKKPDFFEGYTCTIIEKNS